MSIRKMAILFATLGLFTAPALAQSVQDSNTYPGSVPDTPQGENLRGQNDDATGPTGTIVEPETAPDGSDSSGYDTEGGPDSEMPLDSDEEPAGPGPNDQ